MIYGPIDEAKRIKGQEYRNLSKSTDKDGNLISNDKNDNNISATTSTGRGGILDSVAQHHIEDLDLEKEKVIVESNNILEEYLMYIDGQFQKAIERYNDKSKSQLEKRMTEDLGELADLGVNNNKIAELIIGNYYGFNNLGLDFNKEPTEEEIDKASNIIRTILKLRINYVNKITSLIARMLKTNYKMLGLSEEQAKVYIDSLTSGKNDSVKTAGEIKNLIKANTEKFVANNGEAIDLRSLGFGVILGPTKGYVIGHLGTNDKEDNKQSMMTLIQQAMRYDVVLLAHGGDTSVTQKSKNDEIIIRSIQDDLKNYNKSIEEKYSNFINNSKDSVIQKTNKFSEMFKKIFNKDEFVQKIESIIEKEFNTSSNQIIDSFKKIINDELNDYYDIIEKKYIQRLKDELDEALEYGEDGEDEKRAFNIYERQKNNIKELFILYKTKNLIALINDILNYFVKYEFGEKKYWSCQPTKTLKAGPFANVDDLVRQLIKEGYKKIMINDCNPGGHKLAKDIMDTKGVLINHSDFSNYMETSIIDSNDDNVLAINEAELSLREFAESFDIDYNDDEYLEECCQWYLENVEVINEGEFIENLKEFFKKILAGIINFFKKIFEFAKTAFYKLKTLFNGTKEEPKNTKTNFQKPITTPLIDIDAKKTIKIQCANREELEKESSKMCVKFSNVIKAFNKKHQEAMKRINQDIEQLEKQAQNESYGGVDIMSKFLLEDMDLFDVFDDNYLLEFDAEGAPKDEEDEDDEFSMDDEGGGDEGTTDNPPAEEPAPPAEGEGEPAPASEEPPAEDGPPTDDNEGEEFSMDEDPPEEGPEDEGEDNYEIPDDDEGGEGQEGEGDDAPPAEDGPPADDGEDEFSMDGDSGEGGGDTEGGEGQPPADDAPTDDTSGEEGEDSETNTKLKELEEVIFDDLSEDEKKMKITELKALYITVYKKCGTISEMLSGIKKDEETIQIIEYISNTLIDLKDYVNDYINKVFDSKTYIENLSQLQKYIAIFNAIHKVFEQIKAENEE